MTAINTLRASLSSLVVARLASDKAQSMTANNRKKLSDFADVVSRNDAIAELLVACSYSASAVNQNVYSVEKVADIAITASSDKRNALSVYCAATFASMIALEKADIEITRDVIASVCTNDIKTKYDAKIKTTRVQSVKSKSTVATQHNSTINAMLALSMFNVTRNAANDEKFTLNRESVAVKAIASRLELAL